MAKEHHKNHGVLFDYNGVLVIGHEAASNLAAVLAALDGEFKLGIVTRSWRADVQRMLARGGLSARQSMRRCGDFASLLATSPHS